MIAILFTARASQLMRGERHPQFHVPHMYSSQKSINNSRGAARWGGGGGYDPYVCAYILLMCFCC